MRVSVSRIQIQGTRTPYSPRFDDVYFAEDSGIPESRYVYLEGAGVLSKLAEGGSTLTVGEIGFGVGLNFLLTLQSFLEKAVSHQRLHYFSAEQFPVHLEDLRALYALYPELQAYSQELLAHYPLLTPGVHRLSLQGGRVFLYLLLGPASEMFQRVEPQVDLWYWDGFAPSKNPDAFDEALFSRIAVLSAPHAKGASFTSAGWVRRGLEKAGFEVQKRPGFGKKRECISAELSPSAVTKTTSRSLLPAWFSNQNLSPLKPESGPIEIAGAGLAGSAAARALATRGFEVLVYDPNGVAERASGNRAGLFNVQMSRTPNPISRFAQASLAHFLRELRDLDVPHHLGIQRSDEQDLLSLQNSDYPEGFYQKNGLGVFLPFCGFLNPRELCKARLRHPNIRVMQKSLPEESSHPWIAAVGSDLRLIPGISEHPRLKDFLDLPSRPIRGQVLELASTLATQSLRFTQVHQGYVTPIQSQITGEPMHLLGATYQAKNVQPHQAVIDEQFLIEEARRSWPEFRDLDSKQVLGSRVGYRLSTPDKLPMIGPIADPKWIQENYLSALRGARLESLPPLQPIPNRWCFLGLGSRGITFSSLGAEILASLMTGEPLPLELDLWPHLHPMRFLIRTSRKTVVS